MIINHQPPPILKFLKFNFLLSLFLILPFSCAEEKIAEPDWKSQLENITEEELRSFDDQKAILVANAIGEFLDGITRDGLQEYIERTNYISTISQPISIGELATIHRVEEKVITDYIETLQRHGEYISDIDNRIQIVKGLYLYAEKEANRPTRIVFRVLANLFHAKDCGFIQHAARIADTAALGYLAVQFGNPYAAVSAVGSYVGTVDYAVKCCGC